MSGKEPNQKNSVGASSDEKPLSSDLLRPRSPGPEPGSADHFYQYGNPDGPKVLVLGGISGTRDIWNAEHTGWWQGLTEAVPPQSFCVIAADYSPKHTSVEGQAEWLATQLRSAGVKRLHAIVGGSFGGLVATSLARPSAGNGNNASVDIDKLVLIGAAHRPTAGSVILRGLQREFVRQGDAAGNPEQGLQLARALAMLSYRSFEGLDQYHPEPETALDYVLSRGLRTAQRNPEHARALFENYGPALDSYRFDPAEITQPTALIGFNSDVLVPPVLLEEFSNQLPHCELLHITESSYGHDGFIKSVPNYAAALKQFLEVPC